jgi:hypothetical protein
MIIEFIKFSKFSLFINFDLENFIIYNWKRKINKSNFRH